MTVTEERINAAAMRLFAERGNLDIAISELAAEAGVARGTLYRNVDSMELLFERVRNTLALEVHASVASAMDAHGAIDPVLRMATGLRMLVRLAHENPAMGRFIVRFGLTDESLRGMLSGPPAEDLRAGLAAGRYDFRSDDELSAVSMALGAGISAMWMVLEGHLTWREAGSNAAELVLRALGIKADEACELSLRPLPAFPRTGSGLTAPTKG